MTEDALRPRRGCLTLDRHDDSWVVSLHGEHDVGTAAEVCEQLAGARVADGPIIVDLTATTFIDSSVLGALLHAYRADVPPRIRFVAPANAPPRRLFELVGFGAVVPVFERLDDALADSRVTPGRG